jgi:hypothetical protein
MSITYEDLTRWKYRLTTSYTFKCNMPLKLRPTKKVGLGSNSLQDVVTYDPETDCLTIRAGYAYDGPSGPTIDTPSAMRPALIHDALYQLMRMGLLTEDAREWSDQVYRNELRANGVPWWRHSLHYVGLRIGGSSSAKKGTEKQKVFTAP